MTPYERGQADMRERETAADNRPASPLTIDERMALPKARSKRPGQPDGDGMDMRPRKGMAVVREQERPTVRLSVSAEAAARVAFGHAMEKAAAWHETKAEEWREIVREGLAESEAPVAIRLHKESAEAFRALIPAPPAGDAP